MILYLRAPDYEIDSVVGEIESVGNSILVSIDGLLWDLDFIGIEQLKTPLGE